MGSVPQSGMSSGGGNSNPLQYSCQENPMDRGLWQAIVLGGLKDLDTTEHLIDRVPDELWNEVRDVVQETGIKIIPIEKKCKKAKWRPRGVTPRPRSGAAAESTRLSWGRNGREELPCIRGQRGWPRGVTSRPRSGAAAGRSYPMPPRPRPGMAAGRSNPLPRRGAAMRGVTQSCGCVGAGGPRGAIPH